MSNRPDARLDNPYDLNPGRSRFVPKGGTLRDWNRFKAEMYLHNRCVLCDEQMPAWLREERHFLRGG